MELPDFTADLLEDMERAYAAVQSMRVKRAMQDRIAHGYWPAAAPLGYVNRTVRGRVCAVPDPHRAPLVQQAFYWMAEGKHPALKVLDLMTDRGLRSRTGRPLNASSFWKLLTNPFYCGQIRYNGQVTPGLHQPLIDQHTFQRVKKNLKRRSKGSKSAPVSP